MNKINNKIRYKAIPTATFLFVLIAFINFIEGQKSYDFYSTTRQKIIDDHKAIIENIPSLEVQIISDTKYLKVIQFHSTQDNISLLVDLPNGFKRLDKNQIRYNSNPIYSHINEFIHASYAGSLSLSFGLSLLYFLKTLF